MDRQPGGGRRFALWRRTGPGDRDQERREGRSGGVGQRCARNYEDFFVAGGSSLFNDYYNDARKTVDQRLALAGLQLARYHGAFAPGQCP